MVTGDVLSYTTRSPPKIAIVVWQEIVGTLKYLRLCPVDTNCGSGDGSQEHHSCSEDGPQPGTSLMCALCISGRFNSMDPEYEAG